LESVALNGLIVLLLIFQLSKILLHSLQLKDHPLHLTVVVLSQTLQVGSQRINLIVFGLLTLHKNDAVIECFLH
jgi:hypothetical protein